VKYDILIKNGILVDPSRNLFQKGVVIVQNGRIVADIPSIHHQVAQVIDAQGHYVLPGLIENHAHFYWGGSDMGIEPDLAMIPNGVTSVIDSGSTGYANYPLFSNTILRPAVCTIKAYLNVSSAGITVDHQYEDQQPCNFRKDKIRETIDSYPNEIIGLKTRVDKRIYQRTPLDGFKAALGIAESLAQPLAVHVTDPPVTLESIAPMLRKNDIWVHMYQQKGESILDDSEKIKKSIWKAKERGVLFDGASGRSSYTFKMIRKTLEQNFFPDFIGTDTVRHNMYQRPMFSLMYMMSIYLNFGLSLMEVVRLVTENPARIMKMEGLIGTLAPHAYGDICIVQLKEGPINFTDTTGDVLAGHSLLIPKLTLKKGRVVYRATDF